MEYLYILQQALVWIITIFWIYQMAISICSLIKLKDKPFIINKNHKFMAIIPAHNEEAVVADLIESLKKQDYPKELYDIYVIADNCTDNTAKIAKEAGAIVYERFDESKKTKGYALDWFLKQKIKEKASYDAFFVFDADNIVHPDFIKNMNIKLCQGEDVVQGYRDIKNPTDSWITAGYAIFYWTMHRFYHLARYNLGLSPLLNGTGFMVKFDVIKVSSLIAIFMYKDRLFTSILYLAWTERQLKEFALSAERIFEVIDHSKFKLEHYGNKRVNELSGKIEFKNVYFKYKKDSVLKGVSFNIEPKDTVAIVGKSGSGKTTIVNLISKIYEVEHGCLYHLKQAYSLS